MNYYDDELLEVRTVGSCPVHGLGRTAVLGCPMHGFVHTAAMGFET